MRIELDIVPMGDIDEKTIEALKLRLKDRNFLVRVYAKTELPKTSLNVYRKQYNADVIIDTLRNLKGTIIAITDADLYTDKLSYTFSTVEYDGPALISTYRIKPEYYQEKPNFNLLIDRLVKEVIYSTGRIKGLEDCQHPRCLMHKITCAKDIDFEVMDFCKECKINNTLKGVDL
ncbi:MAG: hypothetical protein KAT28_00905 [Candidatus Aenigmarchaeota archaeon]|nr:hypothetical protein [Candidatus Aenigmarchaeota archaeon]